MKLSKSILKRLIKEEIESLYEWPDGRGESPLTGQEPEVVIALEEELTDDEEKEKKELESKGILSGEDKKKLKDLKHKWIKEGKLSSAYARRYGLTESMNRGKVIWHTLTESGKMEAYDMKFGNTIIANIPASEIIVLREDDHKRDDALSESSQPHGARGPSHRSRAKAIKKARK